MPRFFRLTDRFAVSLEHVAAVILVTGPGGVVRGLNILLAGDPEPLRIDDSELGTGSLRGLRDQLLVALDEFGTSTEAR